MGNRVFGCDDCLAVCPWNKFAVSSHDLKLTVAKGRALPSLLDMLGLNETRFKALFSASPVKRTGYIRFMRNCLIAAGNAGDDKLIPAVKPYLVHNDPRLRASAIWALSCYLDGCALSALHPAKERDTDVQAEWTTALNLTERG
jgi:epoxyqueuosine reductase